MRKITLLLALVCSMSMFATRYLVQTGAEGAATWRAAGEGETVVDLTSAGQSLNAWLLANFETSFPSGDEIWLAAGTYSVTAIYNVPANFTLYGGFSGTETTSAERAKGTDAWDFTNETVIDGGNATAIFGAASNRVASYDGLTFTKAYISGNAAAMTTRLGIVVNNCKFINNNATGQGGAVLMNSGGEVYNTYFSGNSAAMGGAINAGGSGACVISGCLFENNQAIAGSNKQGGAIRSQNTNLTIKNSVIRNNEAAGNGSAIYTQVDVAGANKIINCVIYGNTTKSALYLRGAVVYNSTVVNNPAGGVYIATKDAQIYNSVFWAETKSAASVSGVDVAGIEVKNTAMVNTPSAAQWVVENNLALDTLATEPAYPYFADVLNNDWDITYQSPLLNAGSAAISGVPAGDIDGTARPAGSSYDIGAYELPYYGTTVTFTGNGSVNSLTSGDVLNEPEGKPVEFTITADAGNLIESVSYNGADVTSELVDGVYTAPALTAAATLAVEFKTDPSTGLTDTGKTLNCYAADGKIELRGLTAGETISVYSITGARILNRVVKGTQMSVSTGQGIYIVKISGTVKKIVVR